ncbi:hypothetical protein C8R47DRAFT_1163049 [Mycena vitilis]|nr:hypothetical protein C8R47DRAFT_1163049 [Mycena vitilis]
MQAIHQAPLCIQVIVVGGGIAGLACAYVLRRIGHNVVVLDKGDGETKTGGSVRSPPDMTRILREWPGMEDLLRTRGTRCNGYAMRRGDTLEQVGFMKFHEEIMDELTAEFLVLQHDDLHDHLTSLCVDTGVVLNYGCKVISVAVIDDAPPLTICGDIVIGADGHNSLVRAAIVAEQQNAIHVKHTVTGINMSVPTKVLEELDFESMCNYNELTIWMGTGSTIVGTPDKNAETFNFAICAPDKLVIDEADWEAGCYEKKTMPFDLSGYDVRLQKLVERARICYPTVHYILSLEEAVGLNTTLALAGDAAHSVLIHGTHNSAMAIEDAETLGKLFSLITQKSQIPKIMEAYQEIRQVRTQAAQGSEFKVLVEISLVREAHQRARDEALKGSLNVLTFQDLQEPPPEADRLMQIWDQYLDLFNYNPSEKVEDWWSKSHWGVKSHA